ncbi:hypothetical protein DFH09DRAFT_1072309 [Mycena vulgaris]|nr:hypothetical protein DFH09DRAFT_1072309 [Mycena vulgaris]
MQAFPEVLGNPAHLYVLHDDSVESTTSWNPENASTKDLKAYWSLILREKYQMSEKCQSACNGMIGQSKIPRTTCSRAMKWGEAWMRGILQVCFVLEQDVSLQIGWVSTNVLDIKESGVRYGEGESGGDGAWALSRRQASHSGSESEIWVVLEDVRQGIGITASSEKSRDELISRTRKVAQPTFSEDAVSWLFGIPLAFQTSSAARVLVLRLVSYYNLTWPLENIVP